MQNADVVLKGAKYLDVHSRKFVKGDIAIRDGKIVGINSEFKGEEEVDGTRKIYYTRIYRWTYTFRK